LGELACGNLQIAEKFFVSSAICRLRQSQQTPKRLHSSRATR
jgi:hypothetical protein